MKRVTTNAQDPRHPIAVVAERTGLTQDVLRVWERRYGAVTPVRSAGGQRLYSDEDIERLRLMSAATRSGRSIGQVAQLPTAELFRMRDEDEEARKERADPAKTSPETAFLETALTFTRALAGADLEEELRRAAALMGSAAFLENVAAPLMRQLGDEWHAGRLSPAQEHMASAVVHDIVLDMMRGFKSRVGAARIVVTTPAEERHVIGAAIAGATAAAAGWDVIYLGGDLPAGEIAASATAAHARIVALSIVYVSDRPQLLSELRALMELIPENVTVVAGGEGARQIGSLLAKLGIQVVTFAELHEILIARDHLR